MNLFDLYAKISLDTSDYEGSVKNAKTYGESLRNELKNVDAQVSALNKQYKDSVSSTGRYSDETKDLAEKLEDAKKRQGELREELENATGSIDKYSFSLQDFGNAVKTGFTAAIGAGTALVGMLAGASAATEEYRVAQGKLNTAYDAAGYSVEAAKTAYSDFYAILGDTDRATEASQLLAQLAENEEDISKWTQIAAGVQGTFGDSLPIEGLVEASNETAKVGTVTGVLADALNWVGISEDAFNEKLAAAGDESERNRIIMETLSGAYDTASEAFYANNEQIIKNRENQQKLTEIIAQVGDAFDNIRNTLIDRFSPAIEDVGGKVVEFLQNFDVDAAIQTVEDLYNKFVVLSPIIAGVTGAVVAFRTAMTIAATIQTVSQAITAFKTANEAATIAQAALNAVMNMNPFVLIATLVAGVVSALVVLWTTNDDFRNAVIEIWGEVVDFLSGVVDSIGKFFTETLPNAFNTVVNFFKDNWQDILLLLVNPFAGAFNLLYNNFAGFRNTVDNLVNNVKNAFYNMANGIADTVGRIRDNIVNGISYAVEWIKRLPGEAWEWGSDMINGFADGIMSAMNWLLDRVRSIASSIRSYLHFSRPDVGPLRDYETWMPDMMKGLAQGIDRNLWRVEDAAQDVSGALAFGVSGGGIGGTGAGARAGSFGAVNITVNAAPGQNARQIAQQVMVLIENERERRAASLA